MSKNILIISTSLRNNSNSEALAEAFMEGAKSAGNTVLKVTLKNKTIAFCKGCLACLQKGQCIINDDANETVEKMKSADVIVWATPIYYYEMTGQMKTLMDRANSLYGSDYSFRDIYLLSSAAEDEEDTDKTALNSLNGWIACYEKAHFAGKVFAGGITSPNEIQGHKALKEAYDMGKSIK